MEKYTIAELRDPDAQKKITGISTFYLPPKTFLESDKQVAVKMGLAKADINVIMPAVKLMKRDVTAGNTYDDFENAAIEEIESHVIPEGFKPLCASNAMVDLMTKLALDPKALAAYKQNPTHFVDSTPGLKPLETTALKLGHQGAVICSMKGKPFVSAYKKFPNSCDYIAEGYNGDLTDFQSPSTVDVVDSTVVDVEVDLVLLLTP